MPGRRASTLLSAIVLSLLLLAAPARADQGAVQASPPAPTSEWYGGRILVADGASLAILAAGAASSSAPLAIVGVAGWFLASPVVHVSHAGAGRGLGSLALRIGLPVVGILIANIASDGCWREPGASDNCDTAAQAGGLLLGAVAAEILDVAWLARDAHPVEPPPGGSDHPFAHLVVCPAVGGASVGLVGRF